MSQTVTRSPVKEKTCRDCGSRRKREEFSKRKSAADGLQSQCKACAAVRHKHYSNGLGESFFIALSREPRSDEEVRIENKRAYDRAKSKPGGRRCPKCNAKMRSYSVLKTCESCHRKLAEKKAKDKAPG